MKKTNILFLHPGPIYRPYLPDFRDKYAMLSSCFEGAILTGITDMNFKRYKIDNFVFYGNIKENASLTKLKVAVSMILRGCYLHFKKRYFEVIISYDPLFCGLIGIILKYILGSKLIIEINGNLLAAGFLQKSSLAGKIKYILYKAVIKLSLTNADSIKLLNQRQKGLLGKLLNKKIIFQFHDYVSTHYFMEERPKTEKYILFAGFPFYLKGVDILIKAFQIVSNKYPDFTLKLVGHELEYDAKRYFDNLNSKVQFYAPQFYDSLKEKFLNCYCFVLPSRQEGMGRVLLEAMSSGKPVIGANVGGIPEIINEGRNGFLFKSEDVDELAAKLDSLLGNLRLAKKMGQYGRNLINDRFSSQKYCQYFSDMIRKTVT
jgi:glycosyltransferase involved in cell wall biosynthesis